MTFTWYPKSLLATALFLVVFVPAGWLAVDPKLGATAGIAGIVAYGLVELMVTFNPGGWLATRSADPKE